MSIVIIINNVEKRRYTTTSTISDALQKDNNIFILRVIDLNNVNCVCFMNFRREFKKLFF